jgi:flagellar L-ring protein precursor FlgH
MMNIMRHTLALLLASSLLASPAFAGKKKEHLDYAPTYSEAYPETTPSNGGIFQAANGYAPLTSGARASMVGDIITIQLVESTQASKSNAANMGRDGSIGLTPPSTGPLSGLIKSTDVASSGTQTFKGTGAASQSNSLNGEITVTVAKLFPNGNMLVRGQKALTLNRGDEFIQIAGIIRPADISNDNKVLSTRVADARITYSGKGEIARASRQGWLQRFFSMLSPF